MKKGVKFTAEQRATLVAAHSKSARLVAAREKAAQIIESGEKECGKCGETKPLQQFSTKTSRNKAVRYSYCRPCAQVTAREGTLRRQFRITPGEYDQLLAHQDGACAICLQPPKSRRLAVDHDHKTGLIRGLLCAFCNRAVGLFRDDMDRFTRVVTFMTAPPATAALGEPRYGLRGRVTNKAKTKRKMNPDLFERPVKRTK